MTAVPPRSVPIEPGGRTPTGGSPSKKKVELDEAVEGAPHQKSSSSPPPTITDTQSVSPSLLLLFFPPLSSSFSSPSLTVII
ncbi:hypothetical protein PDE_00195 [Penicillium oxalicum 114-2]|uniref:Uncharacterized protein n=1 Tax=Penicillium oxalicum (strain 114-2 / CGMCC 5302) TaxID=933388 RepID=S8ATW0_PENO1|nr:hypothetical protein PDE_00195 [Penicillium oxalicum 114-2]